MKTKNMKIRQIIILSLSALIISPCFAFDSTAYCKKVAEAAGGSYQIYEACLKDENSAKNRLKGDSLNSEFVPYLQNKDFSSTSQYVPYLQNEDFKVSVDESSFQKLGSSTMFQKLTEYQKQQTKIVYDEKLSKRVKRKFWKKVEIVAVICSESGNHRLLKMMNSGATYLTTVLLDKSGKPVHQTSNDVALIQYKEVKNYEPVLNGVQTAPFAHFFYMPKGEINYRIVCEK